MSEKTNDKLVLAGWYLTFLGVTSARVMCYPNILEQVRQKAQVVMTIFTFMENMLELTFFQLIIFGSTSSICFIGLHRYVFLIYKQSGKVVDEEHGHLTNSSGDNRGKFKISVFAKKNNLGIPIAGNFFQVTSRSSKI